MLDNQEHDGKIEHNGRVRYGRQGGDGEDFRQRAGVHLDALLAELDQAGGSVGASLPLPPRRLERLYAEAFADCRGLVSGDLAREVFRQECRARGLPH